MRKDYVGRTDYEYEPTRTMTCWKGPVAPCGEEP